MSNLKHHSGFIALLNPRIGKMSTISKLRLQSKSGILFKSHFLFVLASDRQQNLIEADRKVLLFSRNN
jgi:hypothetical protein